MLIRSFVPHDLARLTELTIETFRPLVGQVVFANPPPPTTSTPDGEPADSDHGS